jgi:hypothetical protein
LKHSTYRVGQGNHDSKWKTFWDSHYNNCDTSNDVSEPVLKVSKSESSARLVRYLRIVVEAVILISFGGGLTTPQVELSSQHALDKLSDHECMNDKDSAVHTKLANISSDLIKLVLKRSGLTFFGFNSGENLIFAGVVTNHSADEPSLSSLDLCSR